MRVLFIVEQGSAPSIRLRVTEHFDGYRQRGIEPTLVVIRSNIGDRLHAIREAARHDVVVLQKVTGLSSWQLSLLQRANRLIIFDFDDAVMFRELKYELPLRARTFAKFLRTIERCAAVVAGNDFLACFARGADREVVVLPTPIQLAKYSIKRERPGRGRVIGWLGLSDGFRYLRQIEPALRRLRESFPELRLKVVSDKPFVSDHIPVDNELWRLENEQANLAEFDVGIMPLADSGWTRGKCSYKLLQYMGVGTAVVASPVGMNVDVIASGENGFLAANAEEWERALGALLDDSALRSRLGAAGRALVERKYSSEGFVDSYGALMERVGARCG